MPLAKAHAQKDKSQLSQSKTQGAKTESHQSLTPDSLRFDPQTIMYLQHMVGNQAVQRLIADEQHYGEATEAHPNISQVESLSPSVMLSSPSQTVQRFNSNEHKRIGDGDTSTGAEVQKIELAPGLELTYGDMVAMAGDFFVSIEQIREFAKRPGPGPETQEEIRYVRDVKIYEDSLPKEEIERRAKPFSKGAKDNADRRYYTLAGNNASHFVNPEKGDADRSIGEKAGGLDWESPDVWREISNTEIKSTDMPSGVAAYRQYHIKALVEAYNAGKGGADMNSALATEAFGAHFLTDAFSSGHIRTERTEINTYWNARVPMFNENLKGYLREKLAERLGDKWYIALFTSEDTRYHLLESKVNNTIDSKGNLKFGDVVAGALHDWDNHEGVDSTIDGESARLYGDGKMDDTTLKFASEAVNLSHNEVTKAFLGGQKGQEPKEVIKSLLKDGLFGAERMIPKAKPDAKLGGDWWKKKDVGDLLKDGRFRRAFTLFANEKAGEFEGVKGDLPGFTHDALEKAVIQPLQKRGIQVIREVINWTPNTGGTTWGIDHNSDDNALDYYNKVKAAGAVDKLSYKQKVSIIGELLDGATIGDEEDAIMDILKQDRSDARKLIKKFGWSRLEGDIDDWFGSDFADAFPKKEYGK